MTERDALPPATIHEVVQSKRFLAADRAKVGLNEIITWDPYLLRERRLLVPIDVQALYVPPGGDEPMVRLPMLVAGENGEVAGGIEDGMPEPFAAGTTRPAGVHLHWAMPDALLRGTMVETAAGAPNRLGLPLLPDRWVVLRILLPTGVTDPVVTGWVLEADRAVAVPLGSWTEGGDAARDATPMGAEIPPDQLTGTVGGAVSWSAVYDAVLNRFAFHDPLDDVAALAPKGVDQQCGAYLVAGWWRDPAHDPLDSARSNDSLHELLDRLRWRLLYDWGDAAWAAKEDEAEAELRRALGLTTADRWSSPRPAPPARPPRAAAVNPEAAVKSYVPMDKTFVAETKIAASSAFATEATERFTQPPWQLRSSLLHGSIYGVPVGGPPTVDRRPDAAALDVAIGEHDDDLLAAFASPPDATADERSSEELLLAAFTAQKLDRLDSPNGIVEVEEHEHASGFSALPGGSAGNDRFIQRVQTGGVGGLDLGRGKRQTRASREVFERDAPRDAAPAPRHARPMGAPRAAGGGVEGTTIFSSSAKPTLLAASEVRINDLARSRVGDVLAPTEARVVDRPALRFAFPDDPMVAVRGASRSLRHGGDGRSSADGKLTCRWPTHVITEITGVVAKDRFIPTLGSGAVPPEVLTLAREVVLHDPYHDEWVAQAVAPASADRLPILRRLKAESVMRFGADGTYDGTTVAFSPTAAKAPRAGRRAAAQARPEPGAHQQQALVADELMRYSIYRGADPDPVAITTWAQPWVPMWLEWEVKIEGLDPATLDAWQLGAVDLERAQPGIGGDSATLRGRALLTTGGATTLHSAVQDWLAAERARDEQGVGLVDDDVQAALQTLDEAVQQLDVVTAALDGVRTQLLGFAATDGLHRPSQDGVVSQPAPVSAPRSLVAGAVTLTRARLLDIFGRTLEVPVDAVVAPARASVDDEPGALAVAPRLLRPTRWQFRLVDASTAVGTEGTAARVDQIEPALQVNPVAGFVMPDHLDESLEVFGVDGSPIGELLHEPVSGGVMWEIAAGREGPADAGPLYGLTPSQVSLGRFAAGLVAADAQARSGAPLDPDGPRESALSALLRAIDTTLWSVDTFAALGSEHVAGLVGRPIAVVRAQLRLELRPPDDVDLSDPARAAEWAAAEERASRYAFPVRVGEVTRSDDGVLGFFVDDDFSRFRLVDKAIAGMARDTGRNRGQLGLYADANEPPPDRPITNPYIAGTDDADTLELHLGQTVTLTIFMHPAGKATLTSGVVPRETVALARDWVAPGLAAIAPSLRTGPVLVETDLDPKKQVRLPKVSVFGKDQNLLWRDTPATWRSDAILAATQTALLPDTPAEFREGWIRVAPDAPAADGAGTGSGAGGGS
jgi:hypothetical protein